LCLGDRLDGRQRHQGVEHRRSCCCLRFGIFARRQFVQDGRRDCRDRCARRARVLIWPVRGGMFYRAVADGTAHELAVTVRVVGRSGPSRKNRDFLNAYGRIRSTRPESLSCGEPVRRSSQMLPADGRAVDQSAHLGAARARPVCGSLRSIARLADEESLPSRAEVDRQRPPSRNAIAEIPEWPRSSSTRWMSTT